MAKVCVFMADGCEEIEALTVVDVLRRGNIPTDMVSINGKKQIDGSHKIRFEADLTFEEADFSSYDALVLPGGLRGTENLRAHAGVQEKIRSFAEAGKLLAAICAAPTVLGEAELLKGYRATCHPGLEDKLLGAEVWTALPALRDRDRITSRGMGTAAPFALEILRYFAEEETVWKVRKGIVY